MAVSMVDLVMIIGLMVVHVGKPLKIRSYPNAMSALFQTLITHFEESDLDLTTKCLGILSRDLQAEEIDVIV